MKKLVLVAALASSFPLTAHADVTMQLPDNIKQTFQQMENVLNQCIGETVSHSEATACQQLHALLVQLSNQPTTPVAKPDTKPDAAPSASVSSPGSAGSAESSSKK